MMRMSPPRLEHLRRLTDSKGLMHAAVGDCPNRFAGYDVGENADALRLCAQVSGAVQGASVEPLARTYFDFLARGRRNDGRVYHHCDALSGWKANGDDGLIQSKLARALAALIVSELPIALRLRAAGWWRELIVHADDAQSPRSAANWLTAIAQLRLADPGRDVARARNLANWLVEHGYAEHRRDGWEWFESRWEIGAANIAEGLWHAGEILDDPRFSTVAEKSTRFLCAELFEGDMLVPPGTQGDWSAGSSKSLYDQRPADVVALAELLCTAERITGEAAYGESSEMAVRWFAGHNVSGASMIDASSGGCHDALTANGPRADQGGAAVVAYLLAEAVRAARAVMHAEPDVYVAAIIG
jgi:hypothetical protein